MSSTPSARWLPAIGTPAYYVLLGAVAILILGPLGGVTAAYMNFSLGFFIGGQVLAGILGSAVTLGYGAEGKHGANYMQTMAASVAGMSGMAVLVQAMAWMGLPEPPVWQLVLYFGAIGMFGVGVGMLYTPILVDRMQLTFPSGLAVANILRALTDPRLLRASIGKLGGGTALGIAGGLGATFVPILGAYSLSTSTLGAGMVVSARIAVPALLVSVLGLLATPYLVGIGWLQEGEPFRKIGFVIALGTILGAAIVDLTLIFVEAARTFRSRAQAADSTSPTSVMGLTSGRLGVWIAIWAAAIVAVGVGLLGLPLGYVVLAIGLVFLFLMVNGISLGISDSNPISSAFVVSVFLMAAAGLEDPGVGLMCASILLIATSVGCDMQQDRSTGWRLGSDRTIQFRFQVVGIVMGAVMSVVLARLFMTAYPALSIDQYSHTGADVGKWQSAMTFKFVGALRGLSNPAPHVYRALGLGIAIGLAMEALRVAVKRNQSYREWSQGSPGGQAFDFAFDALLVPSPYASSFGGFVDFWTTVWFTVGGVITTTSANLAAPPAKDGEELPEDMSTTSLVGGGLIAGDSLAALGLGIVGLATTIL